MRDVTIEILRYRVVVLKLANGRRVILGASAGRDELQDQVAEGIRRRLR